MVCKIHELDDNSGFSGCNSGGEEGNISMFFFEGRNQLLFNFEEGRLVWVTLFHVSA